MKDPVELRKEAAEFMVQANSIRDAAKAEDRELTDDQNTKIDELCDKADELEAQAKTIETKEKVNGRLDAYNKNAQATTGRQTASNGDTNVNPNVNVTIHDNIEDDPSCGFKDPREFLLTVLGSTRSQVMDERLNYCRPTETAGSDEQSTFSDPYGGFLIPKTLTPGLLSVSAESDPIGPLTTKVPMTTPKVSFNARVDKSHSTSVSGGLRVYRRAEADTVSASRMQLEQITLDAHSLMGLSYATEEILTDSPLSFVALLQAGFSDEFGSVLINERLNGTGVGEFEGIMINPALITITKQANQAADTIVYENIIKMRARCWKYGNAIWLANHDCLPQLMTLNQSVGTGGVTLWQPSAREDHPDLLLGRPLVFSEYAKTVGDKGDIVCGNWSQYLEGTLETLKNASSMHVRFVNHEQTFKFWMRNDGRSWWRSVFTPKNGATLSPWVVLEART